ncbi:hypothetical protein A2U01_0076492, partial [Trifolium medium]|nr:hypothetical protein [Trifolium medium]
MIHVVFLLPPTQPTASFTNLTSPANVHPSSINRRLSPPSIYSLLPPSFLLIRTRIM